MKSGIIEMLYYNHDAIFFLSTKKSCQELQLELFIMKNYKIYLDAVLISMLFLLTSCSLFDHVQQDSGVSEILIISLIIGLIFWYFTRVKRNRY